MAKQDAISDKNNIKALLVHSGTADTADTIRATGQTNGAQDVHIVGTSISIGGATPTGFNGGTVSVGTAAVELTFSGTPKAVLITADHNNGTMIYVGDSTVTQAGANAVIRLDPGEALSMDYDDTSSALYAVAGTTGQKVYKLALT